MNNSQIFSPERTSGVVDFEKINLHTHSIFCDGKNSPEEMIVSAIEKGFSILGFSGHSLFPFARSWHIAPRDFENYVNSIRSLEEKYKDKIQILCGFEADYFPGVSVPDKITYARFSPDYLIGSVHYVVSEKGHYSVDNSVDKVRHNLLRLYGKNDEVMQFDSSQCNVPLMELIDGRKAVCEYFQAQKEMLEKGDFEIWGHPDVIRKRNGILKFFDEKENWYSEELKSIVKLAAKKGVVAEINTGAISRGIMDDFYPSKYFMQLLYDAGVPVCISSDSHNVSSLDCAFLSASQAARKIGYKELVYPFKGHQKIIKL